MVISQNLDGHIDLTEASKITTKYIKLTCLKFDGTDFKGWLLQMDQFLEVDKTKEHDKARIVIMHLDGKAL